MMQSLRIGIGALLLALWLFAPRAPLNAQALTQPIDHPMHVFIRQNPQNSAPYQRQLIFVDLVTGEETITDVSGERFSIVGRSVIFYDPTSAQIKVATPDGTLRAHPVMQAQQPQTQLDWVTSADHTLLAWTEVYTDASAALVSVTHVAPVDASAPPQTLFTDTRNDGLRVLPVAFDASNKRLFMDYQPDGIAALLAYPQYAGLFSVNVDGESAPTQLTGEPADFTGAGFGGEYFLRLALAADARGFDLRVHNLATQFSRVIPALQLRNTYSQAGDVIVAPNAQHAIYTLSQFTNFGTAQQSVRTAFVHVDLTQMTQRTLTEITTFVRPVAWTEDNSAIILTSPQTQGTWKLSIDGARLEKIAETTYLGKLSAAKGDS